MEKLISMTEFVLSYKYTNETPVYNQQSDKLRTIERYAEFLNQPLKLGMFIPCDLDDNVLEEPDGSLSGVSAHLYVEEHREAQERVLFEGFELIEISTNLKIVINQEKDCQVFANQYQNVYYKCNEFDKIEDLYKYNLTLTQTALKQIGIK